MASTPAVSDVGLDCVVFEISALALASLLVRLTGILVVTVVSIVVVLVVVLVSWRPNSSARFSCLCANRASMPDSSARFQGVHSLWPWTW
jgi:hypothetical protein